MPSRPFSTAISLACLLVACGGSIDDGKPSDGGVGADSGATVDTGSSAPDAMSDASSSADSAAAVDAGGDPAPIDASPIDTTPIDTAPSCDFAAVQLVFDKRCAVAGCHVLPAPPMGLTLSAGFSRASLMRTSVESPPMKLVEPGDSARSYLYVLMKTKHGTGLTTTELEAVRCWIDSGAP